MRFRLRVPSGNKNIDINLIERVNDYYKNKVDDMRLKTHSSLVSTGMLMDNRLDWIGLDWIGLDWIDPKYSF